MKYCIIVLFSFYTLSVMAGASRDGGAGGNDQALKRMQFVMQQLNAEKTALQQELLAITQEKEQLEKDLKKAKKEIKRNEATIEKFKGRVSGLNNTVDKRDAKIAKREGQLRDVIAKYQDTILVVQQFSRDKADLEGTVAEKELIIEDQEIKNAKLYKANEELMQLYENKSGWDGLLQKEKVTGLKQVEIENILQEYKFKLQEGKINKEEVEQ